MLWAAGVAASPIGKALAAVGSHSSQAAAKRHVVAAIESVAKRLGNTKAVCRKCYIHPAVLDAYLDGATIHTIRTRARLSDGASLGPDDHAVVRIIEERLKRGAA